jgi:hypothetical protein
MDTVGPAFSPSSCDTIRGAQTMQIDRAAEVFATEGRWVGELLDRVPLRNAAAVATYNADSWRAPPISSP